MKIKLIKIASMVLIAAGINLTNLSNAAEVKSVTHSGFIAKKDNKIIKTIGKYEDRHSPFSTFKVALALMGFDNGILKTKDSPKWPFLEEYEKNFQSWYTREKGLKYNWIQDHTPATFMKNSVVWFSHKITQQLGKEKFKRYISKLNYGNGDVTGTPGKDDGLFNAWLGTSLEISPIEQVEFLEKLLAGELAVSKDAQEKTREIMNREEAWDGWKLYGKTGGGNGRNGWFIGWIEKNGDRIVFAQYLDLDDIGFDITGLPTEGSIGLIAKDVIKREITPLLQKLQDK